MEPNNYWQRRISRRRVLRGAALGGASLAAAAVIGCGDEEKPTATPAPGTAAPGTAAPGAPAPASPPPTPAVQPKRGGTVSVAAGRVGSFDTRGTGLDPYTYVAIASQGFRLFYQGLLNYDPRTYAIKPELAQKWEQPSQTEYIFTLQPGVKWHNKPPANGRELTIDDVTFSLERARSPEPTFVTRTILATIDKIEAVDRARLRVTTKTPDVSTLAKFAADPLMILARDVAEKAGKFPTPDQAVGTGAFIMKSAEQNVGAEYVRNPEYWKPGLPYLDVFRTRDFANEQLSFAGFQGGQVDIARLFGEEVKKYISRQGPGYTPDWFAEDSYVFGQPNVKAKPMDDKRVTRALRLLIDHDEMIKAWAEVWFGRGQHGSMFPTALEPWDLTQEEYKRLIFWKQPKDDAVKEGISLLNAAGFSTSNPLKFTVDLPNTPFLQSFAELYQARWKQVTQGAVDVALKPVEIAIANTIRVQRTHTYLVHGNIPSIAFEPDAWLTEVYGTGSPPNFMSFSDARLDELIAKQRATFDVQQRRTAVKEIARYMADNTPGSIPANRFHLWALNPKVRGYAPGFFLRGAQFESVWLDT